MAKFRAIGSFKLPDVDFNQVERLPHVYESERLPKDDVYTDTAPVMITIIADQQAEKVAFGMVGTTLPLNETPPSAGTAEEFGMSFYTAAGVTSEWGLLHTSVRAETLMNAIRSESTTDDLRIIQRALSGNDEIILSRYDDEMDGFRGNDLMLGKAGDDVLRGGDGRDKIDGGAGRDRLTGGKGTDRFIFSTASDSGPGLQRDVVNDFTHGEDIIDLQKIDSNSVLEGNQSFEFIGNSYFSGRSGELRFSDGIVSGDINGDGQADFEIAVSGITVMIAADFVL